MTEDSYQRMNEEHEARNVLVSYKDLEPANHLREWNGPVFLPLLHRLHIVDEDDKVIFFTRIVDFDLRNVSTSHD